MKKRTTLAVLILVLAMLMSACAIPGESIFKNLEKGNDYNADMENANNATKAGSRIWPWEDPSITLPEFTGTVTEPGTIKSLKILAVGDASARDAWYFFPQIAKEAGIEIKIAVLYRNGDIAAHHNENNTYTHYENTGDGWVTVSTDAKKADVLRADAWDYFVINQSIANSGKVDTYSDLNALLGSAKAALAEKNPNAKTLFMQTWTYEINSRNNLYNALKNYGSAQQHQQQKYAELQQQMFADINSTVKSKVITCTNLSKAATNANSDGVIPVGMAVQNMREAYWSDGLARDAEFLTNTGKVLAAVTLFKCITGYDINGMELSDSVFDHARPHLGVIKESANNAYLHPYEVTASVYNTAN